MGIFYKKKSAHDFCKEIFTENNLEYSGAEQAELDEILEQYYQDEDFVIRGMRRSVRCFKTTKATKPEKIASGFFNYLRVVLDNLSSPLEKQAYNMLCNYIKNATEEIEDAVIEEFTFNLVNELTLNYGEEQAFERIKDVCYKLADFKNFASVREYALSPKKQKNKY